MARVPGESLALGRGVELLNDNDVIANLPFLNDAHVRTARLSRTLRNYRRGGEPRHLEARWCADHWDVARPNENHPRGRWHGDPIHVSWLCGSISLAFDGPPVDDTPSGTAGKQLPDCAAWPRHHRSGVAMHAGEPTD